MGSAAVADFAALPQPGTMVDRYRVVRAIAHGGMAAVFAVRREGPGPFNKLLAMKMLLPHLAEPRFKNMFLDEARLAGQLQHPHLAQVFDVGEYRGLPWLLMEFLHGKSLAQCLSRAHELGRAVPVPVIAAVLARAAEGLHAAHEATGPSGEALGVVHRDVSPQNLHLGYDGQVKVVDFGIAAASGRLTTTRTGELKGKLSYVAPEQLESRRVDRRADLWALGVVGWEALAARPLFTAATESQTVFNVLHAPVPLLAEVAPAVPPSLASALAACLVRDPAGRLPDASALVAALQPHVPADAPSAVRDELDRLFGLEKMTELAELQAPPPSAQARTRALAPLGVTLGVLTLVSAGWWALHEPARSAQVVPVVAPEPTAPALAPPSVEPKPPAPEASAPPPQAKPSVVRAPTRRTDKRRSGVSPPAPAPSPPSPESPLLRSPYGP